MWFFLYSKSGYSFLWLRFNSAVVFSSRLLFARILSISKTKFKTKDGTQTMANELSDVRLLSTQAITLLLCA